MNKNLKEENEVYLDSLTLNELKVAMRSAIRELQSTTKCDCGPKVSSFLKKKNLHFSSQRITSISWPKLHQSKNSNFQFLHLYTSVYKMVLVWIPEDKRFYVTSIDFKDSSSNMWHIDVLNDRITEEGTRLEKDLNKSYSKLFYPLKEDINKLQIEDILDEL